MAEWTEGLAYTLKNSGHGPEQITLASAADEAGSKRIRETAERIAKDAVRPIINLSVEDLRRDCRLPERGYLVIQGGIRRLKRTNFAMWTPSEPKAILPTVLGHEQEQTVCQRRLPFVWPRRLHWLSALTRSIIEETLQSEVAAG